MQSAMSFPRCQRPDGDRDFKCDVETAIDLLKVTSEADTPRGVDLGTNKPNRSAFGAACAMQKGYFKPGTDAVLERMLGFLNSAPGSDAAPSKAKPTGAGGAKIAATHGPNYHAAAATHKKVGGSNLGLSRPGGDHKHRQPIAQPLDY